MDVRSLEDGNMCVIRYRGSIIFGAVFFVFALLLGISAFASHSPYINYVDSVELGWKGWFTIVLSLLVFLCLVKEYLPPDVIMLLGAGALVIADVIEPEDFLRGFSQDVIITLGMLFIIAKSLEANGILNLLSKRVLPKAKRSVQEMIVMMFPLSIASAFLNNTPIVLMLTPMITKWAREKKLSPSKFLIPLSYATIMGGTCTLIGTSSNLIVDGMLRVHSPDGGLAFFELAYVGVPLMIAGFLYMFFIGYRLLPDRLDPTTAVMEQTQEFTGEFRVTENCPFVYKTLEEAGREFFHGEHLVEIERGRVVIDSPSAEELILPGDRLIFAGDIHTIAELHTIKGLRSEADPHFEIDITSSHFSEVVIAATSSLIGRSLRRANFRHYYGASVLAIYRQGKRVPGNVGDILLQAGDTLILISAKPVLPGSQYNNDFFYIKYHEKLPLFHPVKGAFVVAILIGMIISVTMGMTMMRASFTSAVILMLTKCISVRQVRQSIRWNLLVLIASAFAFGHAMKATGMACFVAKGILSVVGDNPYLLIGGIFATTLLVTEVITNNAACLLLFPIAVQTAKLAGYNSPEAMKAVAVTVAIAASCSFITPIGYQTNTIVYGPGGYRFSDYMKVGIPLSLTFMIIATFIITHVWPLTV